MSNEVLQTNPFLAAMLDHIPGLEKQCVLKNWILCIPQEVALPESHQLSLHMLKTHVLIPTDSPSEYITLSGIPVSRLNEKELSIVPDPAHSRTVSILFKENVYSGIRGDSVYTLLCLSRPLLGSGSVPLLPDGTEVFCEDRSSDSWTRLLFDTPKRITELLQLESEIAKMPDPLVGLNSAKGELSTYVLIRKRALKWSHELETLPPYTAAQKNPRFKTLLLTAHETCGALACHGIVFASLSEMFEEQEHDVQQRLHDLRSRVVMDPENGCCDALGLTREFLLRVDSESDPAFVKAVWGLQELNTVKTPLEKLQVLKQANQSLRYIKGQIGLDDALPLFLLALLHAAPGLLLANLHYMVEFAPRQWVKANGELAFYCTVFQGAVSLIQNHIMEVDDQSVLRNLIILGGSGLNWRGAEENKSSSHVVSTRGGSHSFGLLSWLFSCGLSNSRV